MSAAFAALDKDEMEQDQSSMLDDKEWEDIIPESPEREAIIQGLVGSQKYRFHNPFKVQTLTLQALSQKPKLDVIMQAPTGHGKTLAFVISMLLAIEREIPNTQVICVAHSLEVAEGIQSTFNEMNKVAQFTHRHMTTATKADKCEGHRQAIIGTVGCIKNKMKKLDLSKVKLIIIDEADELLDSALPFWADMEQIIRGAPATVQLACFSATFIDSVKRDFLTMRKQVLDRPFNEDTLEGENFKHYGYESLSNKNIHHYRARIPEGKTAAEILAQFMKTKTSTRLQTICFVHSKADGHKLKADLEACDYKAGYYSGSEMYPTQRRQFIRDFNDGSFQFLITTNVISRGYDNPNVAMVVNINIPQLWLRGKPVLDEKKQGRPDGCRYLHRAGRSARAGNEGICLTLTVNDRDDQWLDIIEKEQDIKIERVELI